MLLLVNVSVTLNFKEELDNAKKIVSVLITSVSVCSLEIYQYMYIKEKTGMGLTYN